MQYVTCLTNLGEFVSQQAASILSEQLVAPITVYPEVKHLAMQQEEVIHSQPVAASLRLREAVHLSNSTSAFFSVLELEPKTSLIISLIGLHVMI